MTDTVDFQRMGDDELIAELAEALKVADPVPPLLTELAKAGHDMRSIDAEYAELVFDSAVEELAGVRSDSSTREVTFRAPGVEIEVAVVDDDRRRIIGQLVPPQEAKMILQHRGGSYEVESDSLGRFTFDEVPTGPIGLRCVYGDGHVVQTDWVIV